jgi:hypothetical protein
VCDENLLAGMKMFRETLTFRKTSRKILDINVSAALLGVCRSLKVLFAIFTNCSIQQQQKTATQHIHNTQQQPK